MLHMRNILSNKSFTNVTYYLLTSKAAFSLSFRMGWYCPIKKVVTATPAATPVRIQCHSSSSHGGNKCGQVQTAENYDKCSLEEHCRSRENLSSDGICSYLIQESRFIRIQTDQIASRGSAYLRTEQPNTWKRSVMSLRRIPDKTPLLNGTEGGYFIKETKNVSQQVTICYDM